MKTNEVEKLLGVTKQALIYYEKEGLIHPSRLKNNYRDYSSQDIDTLKLILELRSMMISIDEIKLIFDGQLSIRDCLENKSQYFKEEKKKIKEAENKISTYTKRIRVYFQKPTSAEPFPDVKCLLYINQAFHYEDLVIKEEDILKINLSLCISKSEGPYYYSRFNMYFVYVDICTAFDTYSFQLMSNDSARMFIELLLTNNWVIEDPLNLIHLFNEYRDDRELFRYFDKHFYEWKEKYDLEIKGSISGVIKEYYLDRYQAIKTQPLPEKKPRRKLKEVIAQFFKIDK